MFGFALGVTYANEIEDEFRWPGIAYCFRFVFFVSCS
jgi:hypothetical protein